MADHSKIEWTDATWNPIRGCTRVSEGCRHCYAETVAARFSDPGQPFHGIADRSRSGSKWTGKLELIEHMVDLPLRWKKPRRIFVNSMSDLFHEAVPYEWLLEIFAVMALAPQHTFQILTKRPKQMQEFLRNTYGSLEGCIFPYWVKHGVRRYGLGFIEPQRLRLPLPNVWLGISAEDQPAFNQRWRYLAQVPAAVRFLSYEPALGPLCLRESFGLYEAIEEGNWALKVGSRWAGSPDWVIAGGESGPGARPAHPAWFRDLRDQCAAAGVPFFFKQWGEWTPGENVNCQHGWVSGAHWDGDEWWFADENFASADGHRDDEPDLYRIGKKAAGALLDGREWQETPNG